MQLAQAGDGPSFWDRIAKAARAIEVETRGARKAMGEFVVDTSKAAYRGVEFVGKKLGEQLDKQLQGVQEKREEAERKVRRLSNQLISATDPDQRRSLNAQIGSLNASIANYRQQEVEMAAKKSRLMSQGMDIVMGAVKGSVELSLHEKKLAGEHKYKLKEIGEKEKIRGMHQLKALEKKLQFLKQPRTYLMAAGGIGLAFALVEGVKLGAKFVEEEMHKPPLVDKTDIQTFKTTGELWRDAVEYVVGSKKVEPSKIKLFVSDPVTMRQVEDITNRFDRALAKDGLLSNIAFVGPPGTGKTFMAKEIINKLKRKYPDKLRFIFMSGASFAKFPDRQQVEELDKLNRFIKSLENKGYKLIIFVDEAESFLLDRQLSFATPVQRNLVQTFLSAYPKPTSKNVAWIFATNYYLLFDRAIQRRIARIVRFRLPDKTQRSQILANYIQEYIKRKRIKIDASLEKLIVESFAARTEGLSGSHLENMIIQMQGSVGRQRILTQEIAEEVFFDTMEKLGLEEKIQKMKKERWGLKEEMDIQIEEIKREKFKAPEKSGPSRAQKRWSVKA